MGKNASKKVSQKKLIGLTEEALKELDRMKKSTGKTQTDIINDLLTGKDHFNSVIEQTIKSYQNSNEVGRSDAIQALLFEAVKLKGGKLPA